MKIDDLIDQRGLRVEDHRDQCRVSTVRFEVPQMLGCHLSTLPSQLRQTPTVQGVPGSGRNPDRTNRFQPVQMRENMPGARRPGRLPEPTETAELTSIGQHEEGIKRSKRLRRNGVNQLLMHPSSAVCQRFAANPLNDVDRRNNDALASETFDEGFGEGAAAISALSEERQRGSPTAIIRQTERPKSQPRLEFLEMLAAGLCPFRVSFPTVNRNAQLT